MKRKLFIFLLVIAGFSLILYPSISMLLSSFQQSTAVINYDKQVRHYDPKEVKKEIKKAKEYNESLTGAEIHDPFIPGSGVVIPDNYEEILNVDAGLMGVLEIPAIDVKLPIYHGIKENVLKKGVGHLSESGFPIGGKGNHPILSTHRGLPEAKLFTDLDKLKIDDLFYVHIYNDILAYQVDQIKVVEPNDTRYLKPIKKEDHITLLTCTPYGINSHRLLVRGIRTTYQPEVKKAIEKRAIHYEYYSIGICAFVILAMTLRYIWKKKGRYR